MNEPTQCPICDRPVLDTFSHNDFTFFVHEWKDKTKKVAFIFCRVPNKMLDVPFKEITKRATIKINEGRK